MPRNFFRFLSMDSRATRLESKQKLSEKWKFIAWIFRLSRKRRMRVFVYYLHRCICKWKIHERCVRLYFSDAIAFTWATMQCFFTRLRHEKFRKFVSSFYFYVFFLNAECIFLSDFFLLLFPFFRTFLLFFSSFSDFW